MGQWANSIAKYANAEEKRLSFIAQRSVSVLAGHIIGRTPVKTGRLKGNWVLSVDGPSDFVTERTDPDGLMTLKRIASAAREGAGRVMYLQNNQPYAANAEAYGWDVTRPYAMVGLSLPLWSKIVADAVTLARLARR